MPPLLSPAFTLSLDVGTETLVLIIFTLVHIVITAFGIFWHRTLTRTAIPLATVPPPTAPPLDPLDTDLRWLKEIIDDFSFISSFTNETAAFPVGGEVNLLAESIPRKIEDCRLQVSLARIPPAGPEVAEEIADADGAHGAVDGLRNDVRTLIRAILNHRTQSGRNAG